MTGLPTRIASKISVASSGCWEWTGARTSDGYGLVRVGAQVLGAHRVVYEALRGPITGLQLHHRESCPRWCVRPLHLTPMTVTEHRHAHRHATCQRGHPMTDDNVYVSPVDGRRRCLACIRRRRHAAA